MLRVIRANLADGTLLDCTPRGLAPSVAFPALLDDGPWPDFATGEFSCARCGERFRLAVDMYHGAGGTWEAVAP